MKRTLTWLLLAGCFIHSVHAQTREARTNYLYAGIGNETYLLEVADTWTSRQHGLSNREKLGRSMGMVFVFEQPSNYVFWMHQMLFPLDFIWVCEDRVVDLKEKVPPPKETAGLLQTFTAKKQIDKVIELYAGEIRNSGVKVGDLLYFKPAN
jgi:hypothetical protein